MPKNFVPADDGLATEAFLKVGQAIDTIRADIKALRKDVDDIKGNKQPTDEKPAEK